MGYIVIEEKFLEIWLFSYKLYSCKKSLEHAWHMSGVDDKVLHYFQTLC